MKILISVLLSLLLIVGAIVHINNEYTVPKTWHLLFKYENSDSKDNKKKRKK